MSYLSLIQKFVCFWAPIAVDRYHFGSVCNAVVEIDSSVNEIKSQKIDKISNYHSAEFEDNKIHFYYF